MFKPDYIIVGAGAGGAVLAARLAEDKKNKVLLIEAGPDNTDDPVISDASKFAYLYDLPKKFGVFPSPTHWGFQMEQSGKKYEYPRGTGLGGSTNHHAMVDGRGSPSIYDEWAELTGDDTWKYDNLLPYIRKMENYDVPGTHEEFHGKGGWLNVRHPRMEPRFHPDLIQVLNEKFDMPVRFDFSNNPEINEGVCYADAQIHKDGSRSYAAKDLLLPTLKMTKEKGWNNLEIMTDTLVTKVLIEDKVAVGVEVLEQENAYKVDNKYNPEDKPGKKSEIKAAKEVILCGGAFNSPQTLMLSGIGPKEHLESLGIPVVKDHPGVGKNILDHMEVFVISKVKHPNRIWNWQVNAIKAFAPIMKLLYRDKKGPLTDYANSIPKGEYGNNIPIMFDWHSDLEERDPKNPDLHIGSVTAYFRDFNMNPSKYNDKDSLKASYVDTVFNAMNPFFPTAYHGFLIEILKMEPNDKGSITLKSADPTDPPLIDLQLNASDLDVTRLAKGMKLVRKVMEDPLMKQYKPKEVLPGKDYQSEEDLKEYIRKYSSFGHHISGTAKMGKKSDKRAVLDSKLKVHGVKGLRVVDASIFPTCPSYNPSRAVYIVAEVMADLIKKGK